MIFVFELSLLAGKMTKQVNVKTFIHKVSGDNRERVPPSSMPNLAVKPLIADGTTEGIRGMAREPKGRFCLLCEVG